MVDFKNYYDLVKKVDDKYDEILRSKPESFACRKGCHSCCQPKLKVSVIEKENIKKYLEENPNKVSELRNLKKKNPHGGTRCEMLDAKGGCVIYEARPIICRSHGAPILVPEKEAPRMDVCPLNFKDQPLDELDENLKINVSILNTILALVNMKEFPEKSKKRFKLSVEDILA